MKLKGAQNDHEQTKQELNTRNLLG